MFFQRKPPDLITPAYEDRGIFKKEVIRISVQVIPQFGRNFRNDIIIKGFVQSRDPIDLIFPGRRKKQALKLQDLIQSQWTKACAEARKRGLSPQIADFRCTVEVEGSWRARFSRDDAGLETRNHQLYAARWAFKDSDGVTVLSGEPVAR